MPDQADYANDLVQATIDRHIKQIRKKTPQALPNIGICYNCDEPNIKGKFCDEDCRDDYERLNQL